MAKAILAAATLAGVALAGCMNGAGFQAAGAAGGTAVQAPAQVQVMSKSFTISGPRGFCIDTGATRETADGAFAVLGSCAVISGNPRDAKPKVPAMLTASVIPATAPLDAAALDRMTAFFSTEEGRATLARADGVGAVSVLELDREDGLLLVHAEDGDSSGDVTGDYWRGVFEASGQLVTVTVSGFRETPLDEKAGAKLARSFVSSIRKANDTGSDAPTDRENPLAGAGERLASFFNRLP